MTFCIDIDGTICETSHGEYNSSKPIKKMIDMFNKLYDRGHTIIYFTARGATTGIDWYAFTKTQLVEWGVKFHEIQVGKPYADYYIDDRAVNPHFMKDILKRIVDNA